MKAPVDTAIPVLPARNLRALMAFYRGLGFSLQGPGDAPTPYVLARQGRFEIHLWKTTVARRGLAYLRTGSVDRLHRRFAKAGLPARGAPSLGEPRDRPWGMREFTLVDPEGNRIRVGQPCPPRP